MWSDHTAQAIRRGNMAKFTLSLKITFKLALRVKAVEKAYHT